MHHTRNKPAVDMKFRKVRLAFEGPKKAAPRKIIVVTEVRVKLLRKMRRTASKKDGDGK
jgi:hypothetical protein